MTWTDGDADGVIVAAFKVVLISGLVTTVLWVGVYGYLAKFWANPVGKTVVDFAGLLAGVLLISVLSLFFHFNRATSHVAGWIDVVLFARISWVLAARTPLWIRLHMRADGHQSYPTVGTFLREVARRKGRPLWWGQPHDPDHTPAAVTDPPPAGPG
jgi:hypothetical protein